MRTILLALGVASLAFAHPSATAQSNVSAADACSNYAEAMGTASYPPDALAQNIRQGHALVEFTLTAEGLVTSVRVIQSSHPTFAAAAEGVVARLQCRGIGKSVQIRVPFTYLLRD